jgi:hypothetical protein
VLYSLSWEPQKWKGINIQKERWWVHVINILFGVGWSTMEWELKRVTFIPFV